MKRILGLALFVLIATAGVASAALAPVNFAPLALVEQSVEQSTVAPLAAAKVSLCHVNNDDVLDRPYVTIRIKSGDLQRHLNHGDCVYASPEAGGQNCCPSSSEGDTCDTSAPSSCNE